jgi:hypothetical protein
VLADHIDAHLVYDLCKWTLLAIGAAVITVLNILVERVQEQHMNFWPLVAIFLCSLGVRRYIGLKFAEVGAAQVRRNKKKR